MRAGFVDAREMVALLWPHRHQSDEIRHQLALALEKAVGARDWLLAAGYDDIPSYEASTAGHGPTMIRP